jgi:uncharacterized protein DUF4126
VIIGLAATLYVAEFIADKIPAFDTLWDAVHTFIRIPAGAVLAFALLSDLHEPWRTAAALLGGAVALSAHGARLMVNASPEPFTNWGLSFSEELLVVGVLWLVVAHPLLALAAALGLLVLGVVAAGWILRAWRRLFGGRPARRDARAWLDGRGAPGVTDGRRVAHDTTHGPAGAEETRGNADEPQHGGGNVS